MNTNQLTFTRFVAAILIVIFHFAAQIYPFNNLYTLPIIHHANLGVSYFFVLSGFVMIIAYAKNEKALNYRIYIRNRAARILPLYYFAMLLMLIYFFIRIKLLKVSSDYFPSYTDAVLNLFLLQAWVPNKATTINTAAWSLSVEAFFYLIFPLLLNKFYYKTSLHIIVATIFLFFVTCQFISYLQIKRYPYLTDYNMYNPLLHLTEFLAGNLSGLIYLRQRKFLSKKTYLPILFLLILSVVILYIPLNGVNLHNGFFIIFFAPLVYFMAIDQGIISKVLRGRLFIYLGEISYGIYILQFPIYFFFTGTLSFFGLKINQPLFFAYLIILFISSGLSLHFVEKPLRKKIRY